MSRKGGAEMRVGDVWRASSGRTWLITRVEWSREVYGIVLDGPASLQNFIGREVFVSSDRFSATNWVLLLESSLFLTETG